MRVAREAVTLGLRARAAAKVKLRQPLHEAVVVAAGVERDAIVRLEDVVRGELNVKGLRMVGAADELGDLELKPNYRSLGPRFGKSMPQVAAAVSALDASRVAVALREGRPVAVNVDGHDHELSARRRHRVARAARRLPARARGLARGRAGARARRGAAPRGAGAGDRPRDPERAEGHRPRRRGPHRPDARRRSGAARRRARLRGARGRGDARRRGRLRRRPAWARRPASRAASCASASPASPASTLGCGYPHRKGAVSHRETCR